MPRLLINPGTPSEWLLPLKPGVNVVGRGAGCDAQIEHGSISSTHCELTVEGDSLAVKDLGSTNGTFVNRAPVTAATLSPGQRFQLGSVEMQITADAPAGAPAAATAAPAIRLSVSSAAVVAPAAPAAVAAPVPAAPAIRLSVASAASRAPAEPAASAAAPAPALPQPRLHVAAHETAPTPPPGPAPMLADEYSMPVEGPAMCKYHPKSPAAWLCPSCQINFCDLCVASRPGGSRTGKFCRRCSTECVARQIQLIPEDALGGNFFAKAPGAFLFPFKGNGGFMLVIGALGMALLDFFSAMGVGVRGLAIRVSIIGYVYAYMQKIIHCTAQGDDKPPEWPDFGAFWDDIVMPFLQLMAVLIVSFGPLIAMLIWIGADALSGAGSGVAPWKLVLLLPLLLGGAIYFPMGLLAVAMFDSVAAVNPMVVVPAIIKAPLEYLVVLAISLGMFVVMAAKTFLLPLILPIPVVPSLIAAGINFYLFMVQVRLLGLLYRAKRHELGWFTRT